MGYQFVSDFEAILERANYIPLSEELLQRAFSEEALLELKTLVEFDDFEQVVCFYRGDSEQTISVNSMFKSNLINELVK